MTGASLIASARVPALDLATRYMEVGEALLPLINPQLVEKYGIENDIGYISTGGGAFLEVLEGKTLPAFEILARRAAG